MRTTRSLSITLPVDMADMVKAKFASGDYATGSEVIRDGLRMRAARDAALEKWRKEEVAAAYDAHKAYPQCATLLKDSVLKLHRQFGVYNGTKRSVMRLFYRPRPKLISLISKAI